MRKKKLAKGNRKKKKAWNQATKVVLSPFIILIEQIHERETQIRKAVVKTDAALSPPGGEHARY
jgi:hypothetical protein